MKQVTFNENENRIHLLFAWSFAYRKARINNYEQHVLDRYRFQNRINFTENVLNCILRQNFRNKIYNERFKQ